MSAPVWKSTNDSLPPEGVTLETKIDDAKGERNVQRLKRMGRLWLDPKDGMYVYYTPTHWRTLGAGQ